MKATIKPNHRMTRAQKFCRHENAAGTHGRFHCHACGLTFQRRGPSPEARQPKIERAFFLAPDAGHRITIQAGEVIDLDANVSQPIIF